MPDEEVCFCYFCISVQGGGAARVVLVLFVVVGGENGILMDQKRWREVQLRLDEFSKQIFNSRFYSIVVSLLLFSYNSHQPPQNIQNHHHQIHHFCKITTQKI
jgi:hypothetical protein